MAIGSEKNGEGKKDGHKFGGKKALSVFFVRVRREQGGSEIWEESRNLNIT